MKKFVITVLSLTVSTFMMAQTIFQYGPYKVDKKEFLEVYNKNNNKKDYSRAHVEEYINLYSLFRMKIAEAELMKIDTIESVRQEIVNYQNQLAKSFLVDNKIKENLLQEAYQRSQEEINVAHILISSRSGGDTMASFRKINDIYNQVIADPTAFERLAIEKSEDRATGKAGGKIGYISALNVVYPFEQVAYNTGVGQISKPFKTQFGYHILKVIDRRPTKGKLAVQHILISPLNKNDEVEVNKSLSQINEIRASLRAGANFDSMAKAVSQDKFSKHEGGVLPAFGSGQMVPEFETAAFALKNIGDLSAPVKTEYGYHIIKLIKKYPTPSLEEVREVMNKKIEKDGRLVLAQKEAEEQQLKSIGFVEHSDALNPFIDLVKNDTGFATNIDYGYLSKLNKPLFGIKGKQYLQSDFTAFLQDATDGKIYGNKEQSMRDMYLLFKNQKIQEIQVATLEKENEGFRKLLKEYREGILLFDMMDRKVWGKGLNDKEGLEKYYQANKQKYTYDNGFEGYVVESSNAAILEKLRAKLQAGEDLTHTVSELNNYDESGVQIKLKEGVFEYNKLGIPNAQTPLNTLSTITQDPKSQFVAYYPKANIAKGDIKPMEATKGTLVTDYQNYLEQTWHEELKAKYPLQVNRKEVEKLIK